MIKNNKQLETTQRQIELLKVNLDDIKGTSALSIARRTQTKCLISDLSKQVLSYTSSDLEVLLHSVLNGGKEVSDLLNKNCEYDKQDGQANTVIGEVERLYHLVKNHNEDLDL